MSKQAIDILTLTVTTTGAVTEARFVTVAGAQAGAAANALGVAKYAAAGANVPLPVTALGTAVVEAGAAVAAGALVEADANGRAITRVAGAILGRALQAAAAAGDFIEVMLIPN